MKTRWICISDIVCDDEIMLVNDAYAMKIEKIKYCTRMPNRTPQIKLTGQRLCGWSWTLDDQWRPFEASFDHDTHVLLLHREGE